MFCVRIVLIILFVQIAAPSHAQETLLITVGDRAVDASRLRVGTQHYRLLRLAENEVQSMGTVQATLSSHTDETGEEGWLYVLAQKLTRITMTDSLFLRSETLEPLWYRNHVPGIQYIAVDYARDYHVTGIHEVSKQPTHLIDERMDGPRFDFTFYGEIVRTLPLETGFAARLPVFHYAEGAAFITVRVTGSELFQEGGAATDAWLVDIALPDGRSSTHWVAKDTHEALGWKAELGAGVEMRQVRTTEGR